jgi:hypothetical protein
MYEGQVKRQRTEIERHQGTRAAAEKKAAAAETAALKLDQDTARTKSSSLASSYQKRAAAKRSEASKARESAAKASEAVADAQKKLHEAERKLSDARTKGHSARAAKDKRAQALIDRRRATTERAQEAELHALRSGHAALTARLDAEPWANAPDEITVLFVAASPEDQAPLRLDKEVREVQHRLRLSEHRESVRFVYRLAVRSADLMQYLNEDRPHIVHFSGHGSQHGLALEDADGHTRTLDNAQLSSLISVTSDRIRLALFNSCESSAQAEAACDYIDAAIGMEQSIGDESAKIFAAQFYNSLGFGHSLQKAFDQARVQVKVETGAVSGSPSLFVAPGLDASQLYLVAPPGIDRT